MLTWRNYTMMELVAVIVVVGLVSTVAISRFRKMPVFITVESKVSQLEKILAQARSQAVCLGVNTQVVFDSEKRRFYIPQEVSEEEKPNSAEVFLPDEIKLSSNGEELADRGTEKTLFKFYPDGTGGGNSISLELENHKFTISISPLTGSIMTEEAKSE